MKAAVIRKFAAAITVENVADPTPTPGGVVIRVEAAGLCRSDWHGWMGHDPGIELPHVPGHELAGVVEAVGSSVNRWRPGDRVTLPFVCGCGSCPPCVAGDQQVCDRQFQPGFTHWGAFAEYVAIDHADVNLIALPEQMDFATAASLGCRFATAFRALVDQASVKGGQWVAIHGCGGVGLSAVMIAAAMGANVIAIDLTDEKLAFAKSVGAVETIHAKRVDDVVAEVRRLSGGGADVSIDALGHPSTCFQSIACLRKRGKHIQIGLMLADQKHPAVPMDQVIANELEILGSHGMQAHRYPAMLQMIQAGKLNPERLIGKRINLQESTHALADMDRHEHVGVTVIDRFSA